MRAELQPESQSEGRPNRHNMPLANQRPRGGYSRVDFSRIDKSLQLRLCFPSAEYSLVMLPR